MPESPRLRPIAQLVYWLPGQSHLAARDHRSPAYTDPGGRHIPALSRPAEQNPAMSSPPAFFDASADPTPGS